MKDKGTVIIYTIDTINKSHEDCMGRCYDSNNHPYFWYKSVMLDRKTRQVIKLYHETVEELNILLPDGGINYRYMNLPSAYCDYPDIAIGYFYLDCGFVHPYSKEGIEYMRINNFNIRFADDESEERYTISNVNDIKEESITTKYSPYENDMLEFMHQMNETLKSMDENLYGIRRGL